APQQGAVPVADLEDAPGRAGPAQLAVGEVQPDAVQGRLPAVGEVAVPGGAARQVAHEVPAGVAPVDDAAPAQGQPPHRSAAHLPRLWRGSYPWVTHSTTLPSVRRDEPAHREETSMTRSTSTRADGLRVLYLSWRDRENPEAGGAETFTERTSEVLTQLGHHVTLFTAAFPVSSPRTHHGDVVVVHRGSRFGVYLHGLWHVLRHCRDYDVILDVQNGVPFWAPLVSRTPVVNIVHHVHRDQWKVVFGPF